MQNKRQNNDGRMEVHPNAKDRAEMERFWGLRQESVTVRPKVECTADPDNPGTMRATVKIEVADPMQVAHTLDELTEYLVNRYDLLMWETLESKGFTREYVIEHKEDFELWEQTDFIRWVTHKGVILFGVERSIEERDGGAVVTLRVIAPPEA